MTDFRLQVLPVFDPSRTQDILSIKNRVTIHEEGWWHSTAQAFIVCQDSDQIKTLVQKRSSIVDIGKRKYDQSIAVHVQKGETPENALKRGLLEEFGIALNKHKHYRLLPNHTLYITKTYQDDFTFFNRELLHLFVVILPSARDVTICSKIDSFFWIDWAQYVNLTLGKCDAFTKTSRYYICNEEILEQVECELHEAVTKQQDFNKLPEERSEKIYHFLSLYSEEEGRDIEFLLKQKPTNSTDFIKTLMYNRDELMKWMLDRNPQS